MRAIGPFLFALAVVAPAHADTAKDPVPTKLELNPKKVDVTVLKDADGGIYVAVGFNQGESEARQLFYGKGKQLYLQRTRAVSRNGEQHTWDVSMWTPRLAGFEEGLVRHNADGTFIRDCKSEDDASLVEVTGVKADEILKKSQFFSPLFVRTPHRLARDDNGIYYYVDRLRKEYGGEAFRLFIGRKGALKQVPLVDVATDTAGEVYVTKTGSLSITRGLKKLKDGMETTGSLSSVWVKGERKSTLTTIDTENEQSDTLVFRDLGIYGSIGTICENL